MRCPLWGHSTQHGAPCNLASRKLHAPSALHHHIQAGHHIAHVQTPHSPLFLDPYHTQQNHTIGSQVRPELAQPGCHPARRTTCQSLSPQPNPCHDRPPPPRTGESKGQLYGREDREALPSPSGALANKTGAGLDEGRPETATEPEAYPIQVKGGAPGGGPRRGGGGGRRAAGLASWERR